MKQLLSAVFVILLLAACQQQQPAQQQMPSMPQGALPGGMQNQEEIRLLREALKKDPGNTQAWIKLGNMLMDTSQFAEAVDAYQKALEKDPKNTDVRVDMGTCYRNIGKPDLAAKEYRKALEINPKHLMAHKNLAVVLEYDLHDIPGAIKEFEKALEIAPNAEDAGRIKQEIEKMKAAK